MTFAFSPAYSGTAAYVNENTTATFVYQSNGGSGDPGELGAVRISLAGGKLALVDKVQVEVTRISRRLQEL